MRIPSVVIVAAGALCGCASSSPVPEEIEITHVVVDDSGRIAYVGQITSAANLKAMEVFDDAETKPRTLLISSGGGSIRAGMDLGEWILDHGLDVEVGTHCMSSCANYVLLAGKAKRLRRESIVLWHGSAWQRSFDRFADSTSADFRPAMIAQRRRETQFFNRIGVDNLITVYGQSRGVPWRYRLRWLLGAGGVLGYDYSLADLKRLGVSNIELRDGEWGWRTYKPEWAPRVVRVELDQDYQFTLSRFGEQQLH